MKQSRTVRRRLRDLPLTAKLGAAFAALIIGVVAVILVASSGMASMRSAHMDVVRVGEAKQEAALQAAAAASDMHFSETLYVLAGGSRRGDYLTDRQTFQTALNHLVSLSTDASDVPLIAKIRTALAAFDAGDARLWPMVRTFDTSGAIALASGAQNDASDALIASLRADVRSAVVDVAAQTATFEATSNSSETTMIVVGLIAALVGLAVAVAITVSIKRAVNVVLDRARMLQERCITYIRDGLGAFAGGDLTRTFEPTTPPIADPAHDEIGQIGQAMNAIRESIIDALMAYETTRINLGGMVGEVSGSAGQLSAASQQIAASSVQSGRATGEVAHAVSEIARGAERQVQMVDAVTRSADQVSRSATETAELTRSTATAAQSASDLARDGMGAAERASLAMGSVRQSSQEVTGAIGDLADKSAQIGAIVQTITGIAEQTNLLALNAAIEAARAGEQGRGFAVVAEEVRKLAEGSQSAAREISALIAAIQSETEHAVSVVHSSNERTAEGAGVVEQTRAVFAQIGTSVQDITDRVAQIATASARISASAEDMRVNIMDVAAVAEESSASTEQVSASTQEGSAAAEQIAASAQQLAGNAETLNQLMAQFRLTA